MSDETREPLEIERKFLIRMPDRETLKRESSRFIDMERIYLLPESGDGSCRIRRSRCGREEKLYFTEKLFVSARTRVEREREITPGEWDALVQRADPDRRPIVKRRWCVPYAGHTLEIDIFPFWDDRAFCEAELSREDEALLLPEWIRVIKEVTDDPRYNNSSLARAVPTEEVP